MYFVYVLRSKRDGKFYTGITDNINKRMSKHNQGKASTPSTKTRGPFELVYQEKVGTIKEAREREKFLKSGAGREFRNVVLVAQR